MSMLVIGESLIDVIRDSSGSDKGHFPGGSPLNVAVGLSRLGRETKLLTHIGSDRAGDAIIEHLTASHVSLVSGSVTAEPTSIAYANIDDTGHATYEFDLHSSFPKPPDDPDERARLLAHAPSHIHIGSLGAHIQPGAAQVQEWIDFYRNIATISYDPNVRVGIGGTASEYQRQIDEYSTIVDVFKASIEDLEMAYGPLTAKEREELTRTYLNNGVSLVVVTDGARGLDLHTANYSIHVDALDVHVVDSVGAGDALTSALIDGLARLSALSRQDVERIKLQSASMLTSLGTYSATAAAITVTRAGANPPTRREISAQSESYAVEGSIF